jgi:predicted nucleic acid-binding protein
MPAISTPITHFISTEVIEGPVAALRMRSAVAVMRIETVVNVTMKIVRAVEPWPGSDEHAAVEPLRPIVSIWGAVVRGKVVIAVGASRLYSNVDGDSGAR